MIAKYHEEIFQKVMVCGILCEFNDMHIEASSVPEAKYKYEVAGDDESGGEPSRIQKNVMINFLGSIISDEKILMDNDYVLWLDDGDFVWL